MYQEYFFRTSKLFKTFVFFFSVFLFTGATVSAQPFNLDTGIHPVNIQLRSFSPKGDTVRKGRLGILKVSQYRDTAYFFCKGISIYSPVFAEVYKRDPSQQIEVSLHKWNWKETSRKGRTNEKGVWLEQFKTENDFGIMVVTKGAPAVYNLIVWAGDELKLKLESPFVSYDEYEKKGDKKAGKKGGNTIILIGGGVLLLGLLVFLFLRKGKAKKALFILLLFSLQGTISGQDLESMIEDALRDLDVNEDGRTPLNPGDFETNPATDAEYASLQENWSRFQTALSSVNAGLNALNTALGIYSSAIELYSSLTALDNGECTPDFSQSSEAMMPTTCAGRNDCVSCYKEALQKLDGNRQSLARMWCIYTNTKNFKDKATAFGNSIASIGGGAGFGWIQAQRTIESSYQQFKATYDRKYQDFINAIHESLTKIAICEDQFGMRDWYRRFGFMYFEFLQQKYKRTD